MRAALILMIALSPALTGCGAFMVGSAVVGTAAVATKATVGTAKLAGKTVVGAGKLAVKGTKAVWTDDEAAQSGY